MRVLLLPVTACEHCACIAGSAERLSRTGHLHVFRRSWFGSGVVEHAERNVLFSSLLCRGRSCIPELPVETAVLDGLGEVFRADDLGACQIGDGTRDLQNLVVGAGGEPQP